MGTIKLKYHGNTKMIAHRGISGLYVENTISAFKAAGKETYYGIESDTHVTKDGKFIIFHDDTTRRLAKINLDIENTDYRTLRLLPIKFHRMPSLEEYIKCCKRYCKVAVLELKNPMKKYDIDLLGHHAQTINAELIEKSDLILTMTEAHKMVLEQAAKGKVYTLCEYAGIEGDIADPYGSDVEEYEACAERLYYALSKVAERLGNN